MGQVEEEGARQMYEENDEEYKGGTDSEAEGGRVGGSRQKTQLLSERGEGDVSDGFSASVGWLFSVIMSQTDNRVCVCVCVRACTEDQNLLCDLTDCCISNIKTIL